MALASRKNRLSPPLMFVFRQAHEAGDAKKRAQWREDGQGTGTSMRGGRAQQRMAVTERTLREEVKHDLANLMNCVAMESTADLTEFPRVRISILNFGFPDMAHRTLDELASHNLENDLENSLKLYEPRLLRSSIRVRRDMSVNADELKIRYVVQADLSCEPLNVPVEFVADVELDSGKIQIDRL